MWTSCSEKLADGRGLRYIIEVDSSPVSYAEVLHLWQSDAHFRSVFLALLASAPFSVFRWETPPLTAATADQPFEFVVLDSPSLACTPDRMPLRSTSAGRPAKTGWSPSLISPETPSWWSRVLILIASPPRMGIWGPLSGMPPNRSSTHYGNWLPKPCANGWEQRLCG